MDTNLKDLIGTRSIILDEIINRLQTWDKTAESGIGIIECNQESLDRLKTLNTKLIHFEIPSEISDEYNYKLNLIIKELENLTNGLKNNKNELIEDKQQLNKRDLVISSYISTSNEPIFIDKDVV